MRKIKISLVVVFAVLALLLSSAGAAYSADDLANSLYSGWSSSGGGTYGSWYNVALYWLRSIGSDVDTMQSDVASVKSNTNNLATMLTRLTSIDTSLDYIESDVDTIQSDIASVKTNTNNLSTILTRLTSINSSIGYIESDVGYIESDVDTIRSNSTTIVTLLSRSGTLGSDVRDIDNLLAIAGTHFSSIDYNTDQLEGYLHHIDGNVDSLQSFFVNSYHTALENATNSAVSAATDMVTSNPGGTTQAQKNQAISGFSTSAAQALDTGVGADSAWSFLTSGEVVYPSELLPAGRSGNIFAFFSTETMYDLDPSLATRAPQPEVVDYLSLNQQMFDALKGEGSVQR